MAFFRATFAFEKCQYSRIGKGLLRDYLLQVNKNYHLTGEYDLLSDQRGILHAVKLYSDMDQFSGCVNDKMTEEEASLIAQEETLRFLDNLFLESGIPT